MESPTFRNTRPEARDPRPGARGTRRSSGFTLLEVMIASAVGMTIIAAVLSLYLFLSGEGRGLRHQVEFNNKARVLQTAFEDLVEGNYCLLVDADNLGVTLFPNEAAISGSAVNAQESPNGSATRPARPSASPRSSIAPTARGTLRRASSANGSARRIRENRSSTS